MGLFLKSRRLNSSEAVLVLYFVSVSCFETSVRGCPCGEQRQVS